MRSYKAVLASLALGASTVSTKPVSNSFQHYLQYRQDANVTIIDPTDDPADPSQLGDDFYLPLSDNNSSIPALNSPGRNLPEHTLGSEEDLIFTDSGANYKFAFSACARQPDKVVGTWTFYDGHTASDATWRQIYADAFNNRQGQGVSGIGAALDAAITSNADTVADTLQPIYEQYICDEKDVRVELSLLLAVPNNYFTFVGLGAVTSGGIIFGLNSAINPNATVYQNTLAALTGFLPVLASGIIGWVAARERAPVANADRLIAAGTTAAVRGAANAVVSAGAAVVGAGTGEGGGAAGAGVTEADVGNCITQQQLEMAVRAVSESIDDALSLSSYASASSQLGEENC